MISNRNHHASPRMGNHIRNVAVPALSLGLMAGLIACESPADPAPAAALQAAGTPSGEEQRRGAMGRGLFRLPEELGLSAEQQAEVDRIRTELRERNGPLHEQIRSTLGISGDDAPRRMAFRRMTEEQREALQPTFEQLRENHRTAGEEVLALLTPDQRATLDSLRAERRARWEERRASATGRRGRHGPPFAGGKLRLPDDLELTADQQAEIEQIRSELREDNEPLREQIRSALGTSDGDSPRRSGFRGMSDAQREALRPIVEQLRENHRAAMEQVEALLTPDQKETLDSLRAERRSRGPRPGRFFRGQRSS